MRRLRSSSIKKLCNTECPVGSPVRASSSFVVEWLVRVHEKYGKALLDNISASFSFFWSGRVELGGGGGGLRGELSGEESRESGRVAAGGGDSRPGR